MATSVQSPASKLAFNGYYRKQTGEPDYFLTQVGRGTPGGEYLRRFWQPVAYVDELKEVPLRVRALGEDLVAFRDKGGRIGVLHLHCSHRNSSLEFGVIEDRGIRCCYHGRCYDVDGTILEIPGDPAAERLKQEVGQGAYPTHVFGGILFIYMGPPERTPVFPFLDRFDIPGVKIVPGPRLDFACNWVQIKENALDPHHTHILHVIPQLRGMEHFASEFGEFPEFTWAQTPGGFIYLAVRRVGDNVWVRSSEVLGPHLHCINSIFESGRETKNASYPFMSFWSLAVDDDKTTQFFISHVADNEAMPFERRRFLEVFGQTADRPYHERQWIPGDNDAMVSQGGVNVHALEHLGTPDRGVVMFRRYIRRGMETVGRGEDPHGFYMTQDEVPATFANDFVCKATELQGDHDDPAVLRTFMESLPERYVTQPPMAFLKGPSSR